MATIKNAHFGPARSSTRMCQDGDFFITSKVNNEEGYEEIVVQGLSGIKWTARLTLPSRSGVGTTMYEVYKESRIGEMKRRIELADNTIKLDEELRKLSDSIPEPNTKTLEQQKENPDWGVF